jgi:hypothetical protein
LNLPFDLSVNTATLQITQISPCINPYRSLFTARHFFVVAGGLSWLIATPTIRHYYSPFAAVFRPADLPTSRFADEWGLR